MGVRLLHAERGDDGLWYGTFETDEDFGTPEPTIQRLLDAIESLATPEKSVWLQCTLREFNIGYDCGDEPWAFNNGISSATLGRIANLGASLRITLYPPERKREN